MTKQRKDGRVDDRPSAQKVALPGAKRGPGTYYYDPHEIVLVGYDPVPGYDGAAGRSHVLYNADVNAPVSQDLKARIRRAGRLLTPVKVRKEGDRVLCVEGRDRVKALRELQDEGVAIDCWVEVTRGTDSVMLQTMVDVNMGRKVDNPITVADYANRLLAAGLPLEGEDGVSARVKLNAREVPLLVRLLDLCPEVRAAVAEGRVPWRRAAHVAGKPLVVQRLLLSPQAQDPALRPPRRPARAKVQAVHKQAEAWTDDKAKLLLGWTLGYVTDEALAKAYPQLAADIMPKTPKASKASKAKREPAGAAS